MTEPESISMTDEASLDRFPIDTQGPAVFLAQQAHIQTLKICVTGVTILAVAAGLAWWHASSRPVVVVPIRMDAVRGAEVVRLPSQVATGLKAADVQSFLWNWCLLRYRILKGDAAQNLATSRIFMGRNLASRYEPADVTRVSEVIAGSRPEQMAELRYISIPPLKQSALKGNAIAVGHAMIEFTTRENVAAAAEEDDTKRAWRVDLDFYADPVGAARLASGDSRYYRYQLLNPLGIVITNYWESQIPMDKGNE